ncbi:MAG: prephenate dehydratase [Bacteroidales bacterium]|nr:prephenate dehydratase [Bacteroidales bacterium]
MKQIAIQGIEGAFHHIAAQQLFADETIDLICCETFAEVFAAVARDSNVLGLVAIENTIAGSLLPNYELLRKSGLTIAAEHKLHIEHSIMCLPSDNWETLTEVNSHPVALAQCQTFLEGHPMLKKVEAYDTAGAAERIATEQLHGHAAICHANAAELYGLKVLARSIEDNKHNFTRFLLVADQWRADDLREVRHCNKASLVFSLSHDAGCLSQVLSVFSFYHINLTKIQSLPIVGREWEYLFYVDVQYEDYLRFKQSLDAVSPLTREIRVLGHYESKASPAL